MVVPLRRSAGKRANAFKRHRGHQFRRQTDMESFAPAFYGPSEEMTTGHRLDKIEQTDRLTTELLKESGIEEWSRPKLRVGGSARSEGAKSQTA